METRNALINSLLKNFITDLNETVKPLKELNDHIYFAKTLLEYSKGVYSTVPENEYIEAVYFDEEEFIRERLLVKFRDKMVPFVKTSLKHYFAKDDFNKTLLFQKLKIEESILNYEEYQVYINCIFNFLGSWLDKLLILPDNSTNTEIIKELPQNAKTEGKEIKNPEFTRNRQVLMFYYILRVMGIEARKTDLALAAITRFGHALFLWPYTNIKNTNLYDSVQKLPYVIEDKLLLVDLEWVKKQFESIDQQEAVNLVQKEIDSINKRR